MKNFSLSILKIFLFFLLLAVPVWTQAQLLIQDFESLNTATGWAATTLPAVNRVDRIANGSSDQFLLETTAGDKQLKLVKNGNSQAHFLKAGLGAPGVLMLQFDLYVSSSSVSSAPVVLGSFYFGQHLGGGATYPEHNNRFATLDLRFNGGNSFSVANTIDNDPKVSSRTFSGERRVTVFINTTSASFEYMAPDGAKASVGSKKVDVWIGSSPAIDEAAAQAGSSAGSLSELKFVSRNNDTKGTAVFDNFLAEVARPFTASPVLTAEGGTFTVGTNGQFTSLTNPGGVFDALNKVSGTLRKPFFFNIISNLPFETGEIPLNEIKGAASNNKIYFQAGGSGLYTISGDNKLEEVALIRFNGADWVVFDGRAAGDNSEGINVNRHLIIRNSGAAATFHYYNDATNNTLSYSNVQGASAADEQGVIFLGEASATGGGNDSNSFLYNRIGGYGSEHPVNALASVNDSGKLTDHILVQANQFYSFATSASLSAAGKPCAVLAGAGSSEWQIIDNHFFQEKVAKAVVGEGLFTLHGVCIKAGTEHLIQGNYLGGSRSFTDGDMLEVTSEPSDNEAIAVYPSLIPFSVETPGGVVDIKGNTVNNILVSGAPFLCKSLAFGSVAIAGEVNFIDNTFGDRDEQNSEQKKQIIARTESASGLEQGSYDVVPIYYVPGQQTSGRVEGNFIGAVQLEASRSGGFSDMNFVGIFTTELSQVSTINRNTVADVAAIISENVGVELIGIYARSRGGTTIERNVIYNFRNGVQEFRKVCSLSEGVVAPAIIGIIEDNVVSPGLSSEVLVANNMITFFAPADLSSSTSLYYGILVASQRLHPSRIYHNSVYVYGADNRASGRDFVFYRSGTTPTEVKNNIFINTRATDNTSFVIGTASTNNFTSDYNLLYQRESAPTPPYFAVYGAANLLESCDAWKAAAGAQFSKCENLETFFVNPASGNLRILQTLAENPVVDAGTAVAEVNKDIDFLLRINPDIGASEVFNAWIGVVSTDWFDGRNWSTGSVPNCLLYNLLVIPPPGAEIPALTVNGLPVNRVIHQPFIGAGAVNSTHAIYRNVVVMEGASVTIADQNAHLLQCATKNSEVEGIHNRGAIVYAAPGRISLKGVLDNSGTFTPGKGTFVLNGEEKQLINSLEPITFWNLSIEGGGRKELNSDVLVKAGLNMVEGILQSTTSNTLMMDVEAVTTGTPGNTAYVAGRMVKRFSGPGEAFVFPVGDADNLGMAALITTASEESRFPATFSVEYYLRGTADPADLPPTDKHDEDITFVSDYEVWRINRGDEGKTKARVALYYKEQPGIDDISEASVLRWEPTRQAPSEPTPGWVATGENMVEESPPAIFGPRVISEPIDFFTFFTFGKRLPEGSLPVEFVNFTAELEEHDVQLNWETSQEKNSSHFNIQRSQDGTTFETIGRLQAAGNSSQSIRYRYTDASVGEQMAGSLYYRLEQVDIDGSTDYTKVVAVLLANKAFAIKGVYPNPFTDLLNIETAGAKVQQLEVRLLNIAGVQVYAKSFQLSSGVSKLPLPYVRQLQPGLYILEVQSGGLVQQYKVVKK